MMAARISRQNINTYTGVLWCGSQSCIQRMGRILVPSSPPSNSDNNGISRPTPTPSNMAAAKEVGLKIPLVVRLEGNNVVAGKKTLAESGIAVTNADDLADAAKKIVAAV